MTSKKDRRPPVDVPGAAEYLGVTERWVRRAVAHKRIPYFKLGNYLRFSPDDLDLFLEEHRVEAAE